MCIVINDMEYEIGDASTVFEVAKREGIPIPSLCYHAALPPYGCCRLCLVEVVSGGKPGLTASCVLPAMEGLTVKTDSPRVIAARKVLLQLLLARCPDEEVIRRMADDLGVEKPKYSAEKSNCTLCGLCVRACESMGHGVIGFAYRGPNRKVGTPFAEPPEQCAGCQACKEVCPTTAVEVIKEDGQMRVEPWGSVVEMATCERCGTRYTPVPLKLSIGERLKSYNLNLNLCPACHKKVQAKMLAAFNGANR